LLRILFIWHGAVPANPGKWQTITLLHALLERQLTEIVRGVDPVFFPQRRSNAVAS
jgi:hypothetical protein